MELYSISLFFLLQDKIFLETRKNFILLILISFLSIKGFGHNNGTRSTLY